MEYDVLNGSNCILMKIPIYSKVKYALNSDLCQSKSYLISITFLSTYRLQKIINYSSSSLLDKIVFPVMTLG